MENTATQMEVKDMGNSIDTSQIKGWGIDANPENDPVYPMKTRNNGEHAGYTWERPAQQPESVEVLHSNERPNLSAVFGTSTPPSGLSGVIRRYAFKHSEDRYRHWIPLILADRINVYEGIIDDIKQGIIPNIFAEKGIKAEWKYNRKGLIEKAVAITAVAAVVITILSKKKR